jgi:hypothetical protein
LVDSSKEMENKTPISLANRYNLYLAGRILGVSVCRWRQVEAREQMCLTAFSKEVREAQAAPFVAPYRTEPFVGVEDP